jgi:transposase
MATQSNTNKATINPKAQRVAKPGKQAAPAPKQGHAKAEVIYLGVDVHLKQHVVCRKNDGETPQPAQRMTPPEFEAWAIKQLGQARRVVCCYEAGPFGYTLQRRLSAAGITCHVVCPQDWDRRGERVKTDGRDARELVEALARYEGGNRHAMAVVRVPTVEQEQRRAISRQRGQMVKEARRLAATGRSHGMTQGHPISGRWWRERGWKALCAHGLPQALKELLEPLRELLLKLDEIIARRTAQVEAQQEQGQSQTQAKSEAKAEAQPQQQPKGLGAMSASLIGNEVLDWSRFTNRRQVSSYTGLCPSEHSSGGSRRRGSVNRHGNPRLRHALVETVWRLIRYQPGWRRLQTVLPRLTSGLGLSAASKKKLVVSLARQLAVDLWRLNTGRSTLEQLGLAAAATAVAA